MLLLGPLRSFLGLYSVDNHFFTNFLGGMATGFTARVVALIDSIPEGKVMTYGRIAALAGNPRGARQVAWILHSSSGKYDLPWHRIINRHGQVSPRPSLDGMLQRQLLEEEGVVFDSRGRVDLEKFAWIP